jgi:DNA-binding MarR family transcriptional regulator
MSDADDRLLHVIHRTYVAEIRSNQPDLNLRQLAVLLVVYLTDEPQTVRGLAKRLNVNKSAITRALDRLGELDLVQRAVDGRDLRSVLVQPTADGTAMVKRLGVAMVSAAASLG